MSVENGSKRLDDFSERLKRMDEKLDVLIEGINRKADRQEIGKLRERVQVQDRLLSRHRTYFQILGSAIVLSGVLGALTRYLVF